MYCFVGAESLFNLFWKPSGLWRTLRLGGFGEGGYFLGFLFLIEERYKITSSSPHLCLFSFTGTGLCGGFFFWSLLHALICGLVLDSVRRQGLLVAIRRAFRGVFFGKIWLVDSAVLGCLACAACFICLCLPLMIVMWPFPRQIECGGQKSMFSLWKIIERFHL